MNGISFIPLRLLTNTNVFTKTNHELYLRHYCITCILVFECLILRTMISLRKQAAVLIIVPAKAQSQTYCIPLTET